MLALNPYYGESFTSFVWIFFERLFTFGFLSPAPDEVQFWALSCVALSSSLLGVFLVLRKMTMLANGLSHTVLLGIVLAFLLTTSEGHGHHLEMLPLWIGAISAGLFTTFLTRFLNKTLILREDASIGLVFTSLFSVGVILLTVLLRNAHIGLEVITGNADALTLSDVQLVFAVLVVNVILVTVFYKELLITSFDPGLARALGMRASFYDYLLMILLSATSIAAFRAIGVLLFLAFLVGPALTARLICKRLGSCLAAACFFSVTASFMGVAVSRHALSSYHMPLSTSGVTVCAIAAQYALVLAYRKGKHAYETRQYTR